MKKQTSEISMFAQQNLNSGEKVLVEAKIGKKYRNKERIWFLATYTFFFVFYVIKFLAEDGDLYLIKDMIGELILAYFLILIPIKVIWFLSTLKFYKASRKTNIIITDQRIITQGCITNGFITKVFVTYIPIDQVISYKAKYRKAPLSFVPFFDDELELFSSCFPDGRFSFDMIDNLTELENSLMQIPSIVCKNDQH